jgi:hypothetical protein
VPPGLVRRLPIQLQKGLPVRGTDHRVLIIPIVFVTGGDTVGNGLVATVAGLAPMSLVSAS